MIQVDAPPLIRLVSLAMMTKRMALAAAIALAACTHDGAVREPGAPPPPHATSAAITELLGGVPGNAAALAFIDLERTPWDQLVAGTPLPLDAASRKALDKELREYVERYLGLDLTRLQYAVGFASVPPPRAAVLIKTVGGTPKIPGATDYQGGELWLVDRENQLSLAIRGGVVAFGEDSAVREALDTLAGKRTPITVDNPALVSLLRKDSNGALFALAAIKPKDLPLPPPFGGLARFTATLNASAISATLEGDDPAISWLQQKSDEAFAEALKEAQKAHDKAIAGKTEPIEGVGAIIAAAYLKSYITQLRPRRTGNQLSASIDLGAINGSSMTLSVIGIMAAVAIPAFMDYTKRSKKTEAALELNKLGKSAKRAYAETGKFPPGTAPLTPPQPCCGSPNNHCPAVPEMYTASKAWTALDFEIDEPTLFQYSYSASADGKSFVAKAVGDLDCDGVFITYELTGSVVNGNPTVTLVEPPPGAD